MEIVREIDLPNHMGNGNVFFFPITFLGKGIYFNKPNSKIHCFHSFPTIKDRMVE